MEGVKKHGTLKDGLLAWVFRVLLTSGNIFYGENGKHWYSKSIKGIWAKKVLDFHFPLYHYEAIPSPALLTLINDNTQLLKLKALISLSSLPISKASIIPVFPGTLKLYLRYIHLFPSPSPLPRVQVVIISQLISTLP